MNFATVSKWFTGKALKEAEAAFAILAQSVEQGFWVKGGGLKVTSRLNKQNVAKKWAKAHEGDLVSVNHYSRDGVYQRESSERGWTLHHNMYFGSFRAAQETDWATVEAGCQNDAERAAVAYARAWAADWAEVAAAIELLDSRKPQPVFTSLGLSPTVTMTLSRLGVAAFNDDVTIEVPPFKTEWVKMVIKGREVEVPVSTPVWPEGTEHNTSMHAHSGRSYNCCHACGHAIRNGYNWCPIVVKVKGEAPKSMLIGRDCALNIFRIKMDGDLHLAALAGEK